MEIGAHEAKHIEKDRIANSIEDVMSSLAGDDDLLGAEDGEVLGNIGLLHTELFNENACGEFSRTQKLEDRDAGGMGECLKDFSFEVTQGLRHIYILAYSNIRLR